MSTGFENQHTDNAGYGRIKVFDFFSRIGSIDSDNGRMISDEYFNYMAHAAGIPISVEQLRLGIKVTPYQKYHWDRYEIDHKRKLNRKEAAVLAAGVLSKNGYGRLARNLIRNSKN